jgi:antitoxin component of MazEF toxin-antitoxin module
MKKLVKHGNSLALVIEKPILEIMGIDEHTELEIVLQDGALVIQTPDKVRKNIEKEDIKKIAKQVMERYDSVFRKLAKT